MKRRTALSLSSLTLGHTITKEVRFDTILTHVMEYHETEI